MPHLQTKFIHLVLRIRTWVNTHAKCLVSRVFVFCCFFFFFDMLIPLGYIHKLFNWTKAKGSFPLSDCDCDVANNWVLLVSMQLFTSSDVKHQRKISHSQSLSGNGPRSMYCAFNFFHYMHFRFLVGTLYYLVVSLIPLFRLRMTICGFKGQDGLIISAYFLLFNQ